MKRHAAYAGHQVFIAPARKRAEVWRFVLGMVLAVAAFVSLNQLFFQVVYGLAQDGGQALYQDLLTGATPLAMYLLLFSFGLMIVSVWVPLRLLHGRALRSLLGPWHLCLKDFWAVSRWMIGLGLVLTLLPPWDMGGELVASMDFSRWIVLLPLSLLAVLVQVSAEEIVFRGYVQQQLAARFAAPLVWMVLPSVVFALGHYLPDTAGENALVIAVWAGMFGILMADLTARSGSLGPAIAVHLWNNVSAILIVSLPDDLAGLTLMEAPFSMADTEALRAWLPVDFALMLVMWLAARVAIRR